MSFSVCVTNNEPSLFGPLPPFSSLFTLSVLVLNSCFRCLIKQPTDQVYTPEIFAAIDKENALKREKNKAQKKS